MEDKKKRVIVVERKKLFKVGGSIVITLPKEWVERHGLEAGDEVGLVADAICKIIPVKEIE